MPPSFVYILSFLVITGINAVRPMVSYRALELGASASTIGIIAGSYAALALFMAIPMGRWVDRFGEAWFMILGSLGLAILASSIAAVRSLWMLGAAHALLGLGQLALVIGLQARLANRGDPGRRDQRFGALTVATSLGQIAGPALGASFTAVSGSTSAAFLAAGGVTALAVPLAIGLNRRPASGSSQVVGASRQPSSRQSLDRVVRIPGVPHAILASLAVLASVDILIAYLPLYGEASGIPVTIVATLLSVRAALSLVSRLMMVPLIRGLGRRRSMAMSVLLPGLALLALPTTTNPWVLGVLIGIAGFGLGLGQPLSLAWIASAVPSEVRGIAFGLRLTGNRLGQLGVPAGVGLLAGATGVGAVFLFLGASLSLSAVMVSRAPFENDR